MSKFQDWLIFLRKNLIRLESYNETIIHGIDLGTVMLIMDLTGILSARIKKKKTQESREDPFAIYQKSM